MNPLILFALIVSLTTLAYTWQLARQVRRLPIGTPKMQEIAQAVAEGARAYLWRQNKTVAAVALVLIIILARALGAPAAGGFALGATVSALAGVAGMLVATQTNLRVAAAAREGLARALAVAFSGGTVTGFLVAALGLFSVAAVLAASSLLGFGSSVPLVALGFGGSLISVFARLGGGIYTKGADVGTDLVGKIEEGIPEDSPQNPGVIADLVGDNVGDDAGMAADLFETYVVTLVSAILLGELLFPTSSTLYPIAIGSVGLLGSVLGSFFVKLAKNGQVMPALYRGLGVSALASLLLFLWLMRVFPPNFAQIPNLNLFLAFATGLGITFGMMAITEFFTSKASASVKGVAQAATSGHGPNIIAGLALSLRATFPAVLLIAAAILFAWQLGGLYTVAISAVSMLSLAGIIVAIDAFGPITDNAGGMVEMTNQPARVRRVTDALDAVGNTTKAVTKAYAIASAALAALVLFAAYTEELQGQARLTFQLSDPLVLVGLLVGASLPYLFASLALSAVGRAAAAIVSEIRRQFREIPGLRAGKARPDYARCVDIVTLAALKEMVIPALLPVLFPILVGKFLGPQALGGLLMGTIVSGLFVAISMTTGGAAWDNAKKFIEEGHFGGQGSAAHLAAVTGDTVGDPYKDTAGPAINPVIKVTNVVALLLAPFLI